MRISVDGLNIGFILLAFAVAHIVPFELLLFSYAVLGPAHYLTQIAWMHDRQYFCNRPGEVRYILPLCLLFCWLALMVPCNGAFGLLAAMACALFWVMPGSVALRSVLLGMALLTAWILSRSYALLLVGILLPTVIHVFVFTALFMLSGALRSRAPLAWAAFFLLLAGAVSFFVTPMVRIYPLSAFVVENNWAGNVVVYMRDLLQLGTNEDRYYSVMGFLSFAYTYHYLNWFSKVELIGWHKSALPRILLIVLLYGASLAVYAYSYKTGLATLAFLSLLHVLLEFPLNLRTMNFIGRKLTMRPQTS